MSTRVAPIFPVSDLAAALAYYRGLGFGARQWHGGGYGFVTFDGAEIHLGVEPDLDTRTDRRSTAYLFVEDADALAQTWLAAGADVRLPQDTEWGQHEGVLVDPDGNVIRFGSPMNSDLGWLPPGGGCPESQPNDRGAGDHRIRARRPRGARRAHATRTG